MIKQIEFSLPEYSRGYHLVTRTILGILDELPKKGILHLFIKHTSAGLTINENADTSVRIDFETIMNKIAPENSGDYLHTLEGVDDMPAHIKASLIGNSITIPISNHQLNIGTWQGIYLCEFRNKGGPRKIVATVYS